MKDVEAWCKNHGGNLQMWLFIVRMCIVYLRQKLKMHIEIEDAK